MHPDKNKDDPDANEKFAEIGNGACARSACAPLCLRCGFGSAPAARAYDMYILTMRTRPADARSVRGAD